MGQAIDRQMSELQDVSAARIFSRYVADVRRFVIGVAAFIKDDQREFHDLHEIEVAATQLGGGEYYLTMKPEVARNIRREVATEAGVEIEPSILEKGIMVRPARR